MKDVQQMTCLASGRPIGPADSTSELLNTPKVNNTVFQFRGGYARTAHFLVKQLSLPSV